MIFAFLLLHILHTNSQITKVLAKPAAVTSQISLYVKIHSQASAAVIPGGMMGTESTDLKGKAVTTENIAS